MTVSALVLDSGDVRCGRCRRYGIDASESTGAVGFLMDSRVPVNHSFGFPGAGGNGGHGCVCRRRVRRLEGWGFSHTRLAGELGVPVYDRGSGTRRGTIRPLRGRDQPGAVPWWRVGTRGRPIRRQPVPCRPEMAFHAHPGRGRGLRGGTAWPGRRADRHVGACMGPRAAHRHGAGDAGRRIDRASTVPEAFLMASAISWRIVRSY